jgi:hypothetical protein
MAPTIILPPLEALDSAAAHLVEQSADASHERALNKALWHLQSGIELRSTTGIPHSLRHAGRRHPPH